MQLLLNSHRRLKLPALQKRLVIRLASCQALLPKGKFNHADKDWLPLLLAAWKGEYLTWIHLSSLRSSVKLTPPPPGPLIGGETGALAVSSSVTGSSH